MSVSTVPFVHEEQSFTSNQPGYKGHLSIMECILSPSGVHYRLGLLFVDFFQSWNRSLPDNWCFKFDAIC